MNRPLTFLLLILVPSLTISAWDQKFLEPSIPVSPTLKAQGGASSANATGYDALFVNPASFAEPKASLTLFNLESTVNIPLSTLSQVLDARASWGNTNYLDTSNPMTSILNNLLTKTGLGAETSFGLGWVGNNLGVGFSFQAREAAKGRSLLGAATTLDMTMQGVVGMGWPFDVGLGTLRVGGAIRPMQRTLLSTTATAIKDNMGDLSAYTVSSGFGLGLDLGVRWDYEAFKTAFVIRDASSTVLGFKDYTASAWAAGFGFPAGGSTTGNIVYRIPTVIALGSTWTPDVGTVATLVQPSLSLDFQIPIQDEFTQSSFFTWTHVGGEVKFLQFLAVRAGLNQGYVTFGMGAKLYFFELNMAIFADELGRYSGSNRRSGLSVETSFKL